MEALFGFEHVHIHEGARALIDDVQPENPANSTEKGR